MQNATPNPADNTRYGYKNHEGHRLAITADKNASDHLMVGIKLAGNFDSEAMSIPNADAPAVALAILTAAGVTPAPYDAADSLQRALAQLEEHEGIRRNQHAAAELTRRRDELARTLRANPQGYASSFDSVRAAIDMIIQLQDEATK